MIAAALALVGALVYGSADFLGGLAAKRLRSMVVTGIAAASRIFGQGKTMVVHRVEDLPNRLSELYFGLARR